MAYGQQDAGKQAGGKRLLTPDRELQRREKRAAQRRRQGAEERAARRGDDYEPPPWMTSASSSSTRPPLELHPSSLAARDARRRAAAPGPRLRSNMPTAAPAAAPDNDPWSDWRRIRNAAAACGAGGQGADAAAGHAHGADAGAGGRIGGNPRHQGKGKGRGRWGNRPGPAAERDRDRRERDGVGGRGWDNWGCRARWWKSGKQLCCTRPALEQRWWGR